MRQYLVAVFLLSTAGLLVSFQNCSKAFKASTDASGQSSTGNCVVKPSADMAAIVSKLGTVECDPVGYYECEARIFSPTAAGQSLVESVCPTGNSNECLNLQTLVFNTATARDQTNEAEFLLGGEYNRTEFSCFHRAKFEERAVFVGKGNDLTGALAEAMSSCRSASSGGK